MTRAEQTEHLIEAVARQYKLTPEQLKGKDRTLPQPEARAVFFYIAINILGLTTAEAGQALNKKRSNATLQGNKIAYSHLLYSDLRYNIDEIKKALAPKLENKYYQMYANLGGYEI
jgi:chromosomal replication initiation ATPase DnaA